MVNLTTLLEQYELLTQTSKYLSTLDIFHLSSANSELYALIRKNKSIWTRLKRQALCDGHGLKARQDFTRIYALRPEHVIWGKGRKAHYDEELEVRVWQTKCDAANALPCRKCEVNVCEECRYVPRERDLPGWLAFPRPHFSPTYQCHTVICYCEDCDSKIDQSLPFSLEEFCDCDQYRRWICLPCREAEIKEDEEYFSKRTKLEDNDVVYAEDGSGRWIGDHGEMRAFWCSCGTRAPNNLGIRCIWCKRKHNLDTWYLGNAGDIPFFDDDPYYPREMSWEMEQSLMRDRD